MNNLPKEIVADLAKSNLVPMDMDIRLADNLAEMSAVNAQNDNLGYVIPYFQPNGDIINFYRVRLLKGKIKYKQMPNTPCYVYYPKNFQEVFTLHYNKYNKYETPPIVFITEGEKKATLACKMGYPTVGLGGVNSWLNRNIVMNGDHTSVLNNKDVTIGLPKINDNNLAVGLKELILTIKKLGGNLCIIFDSDFNGTTKYEVQEAACLLSTEFRYYGVNYNQIRQIILPSLGDSPMSDSTIVSNSGSVINTKTGLDDYLMSPNATDLVELFYSHGKFPFHPNIHSYINKKLQAKPGRKIMSKLGMLLLADLDNNGTRLKTHSGDLYYFDNIEKKLIKVNLSSRHRTSLAETQFGQLLYLRYGLSTYDNKVIDWLHSQFASEDPITNVVPHRIIAMPMTHIEQKEDTIRYQLNDSHYIKINKDDITIKLNGDDGYMFEVGHVDNDINMKVFKEELIKQFKNPKLTPWWKDIIDEVHLNSNDDKGKNDVEYLRKVITYLYYVSPFLIQWRGSNMPIENIIGEAGSGKSSLFMLRMNILTGRMSLKREPANEKDWATYIANTGGLFILDNIRMADKYLKNKLSDEMCRITTAKASGRTIETRKLYTDNEQMQITVSTVFGFTSIAQVFPSNTDLLERSIIIELNKVDDKESNEGFIDWVEEKVQGNNTREKWLAHHFVVLHRFFKLVDKEWDNKFKSSHRLVNLVQSLQLMGKLFGHDVEWLPEFMARQGQQNIQSADWVIEGIKSFIVYCHSVDRLDKPDSVNALNDTLSTTKYIGCNDISTWCITNPEFNNNITLTNSRSLGRYIQQRKSLVSKITGLTEAGNKANKIVYRWIQPKDFSKM